MATRRSTVSGWRVEKMGNGFVQCLRWIPTCREEWNPVSANALPVDPCFTFRHRAEVQRKWFFAFRCIKISLENTRVCKKTYDRTVKSFQGKISYFTLYQMRGRFCEVASLHVTSSLFPSWYICNFSPSRPTSNDEKVSVNRRRTAFPRFILLNITDLLPYLITPWIVGEIV